MMFYPKLLFFALSIFVFVSLNYIFGLFVLGKNFPSQFEERGGSLILEASRGLFCFFVFIGHSVLAFNMFVTGGDFWPPPDQYKTLNYLAAVGIDGFFLITGYLFAGQLAKGITSKSLLAKRVSRLVPPFLMVTIFIVVLRFAFGYNQNPFDGFYVWTFPRFAYKLPEDYVVYGHYWSLRNEWLFYIFVATALFFTSAFRFSILFALVLISSFFDSTFSMILLGLILHLVNRFNHQLLAKFPVKFCIFAVIVLFILYLWFAPFSELPNLARYSLRLGVTFMFGLLITRAKLDRNRLSIFINFVSYSGAPAYSLYLFHGFALYFVLSKMPKHTEMFLNSNYLVFPFLVIPLWIFLSWVAFWFAERPYHSKKLLISR